MTYNDQMFDGIVEKIPSNSKQIYYKLNKIIIKYNQAYFAFHHIRIIKNSSALYDEINQR